MPILKALKDLDLIIEKDLTVDSNRRLADSDDDTIVCVVVIPILPYDLDTQEVTTW